MSTISNLNIFQKKSDNSASESADLRTNDINALRTMLTMLSHIHTKSGVKAESLPSPTIPQSKELKVLAALAIVLVMEHEKVAVVAKHGNGERGQVEVIACTNSSIVTEPRKNERQQTGTKSDPTNICNPMDKYYPNGATLDDLQKDVKENWKHDDFLRHAATLSEYLRHPKILLEYVVATCYRKMRNRLEDSLSEPYLRFLYNIESSSSFPQFTDKMTTPEPLEGSKSNQDKRKTNDERFFDMLPSLELILKQKFDGLRRAYKKAKDEKKDAITAYNKDTYKEYHQLLCGLLSRFKESLDKLDKLKNAHETPFKFYVGRARRFGNALQAMAGGNVMEMHMKIITIGHDKSLRAVVDMGEETEPDEELRQIGSKLPWQACCEWLKLMVVHFDAVRILITHVNNIANITDKNLKSYRKVVIKVITTHHPDKMLLPWKKLLENERYFDDFSVGRSTSDIITFLEDWKSQNAENSSGRHVEEIMTEFQGFRSQDKIQNLASHVNADKITQVQSMKACQSPGSNSVLSELIGTMQSFMATRSHPELALNNILILLGRLKDRALIFNMLRKGVFEGSIHCEIILACFMMRKDWNNFPEQYKRIADELKDSGPVIGVSKPCCPVCTTLLNYGPPFICRGSHKFLSACTLPDWAPESLIDDAIKYYKSQLRTALVDIMGSTVVRNRTTSIQSDTLSQDTLEHVSDRDSDIEYYISD